MPDGAGCFGTTYSTLGLSYSQVCGQARGYHYGTPDAFYTYIHDDQTINGDYVDGLSITYGSTSARKHIWTYAAGALQTTATDCDCPCIMAVKYSLLPLLEMTITVNLLLTL